MSLRPPKYYYDGPEPDLGGLYYLVGKDASTVTLFSDPAADPGKDGNSWRGPFARFKKLFRPA